MGDGKLVRRELLGTIPFLLNQATTKRVQFVMCITIAPHHPPIMGIQSLMRTSNLLFKCAIRITWWPAYEYSWLSVKSRNRDDVNELSEFSCRHSFRGSGHTTFFVYIFSQGLLVWVSYLAVLSSYNHLKIFNWRLLNKESAADVVRPITLSVIGQFDVIVLDLISHSMFWRISREF